MSLRNNFYEDMKGDSKLLITEATFGFCCFAHILVSSSVTRLYTPLNMINFTSKFEDSATIIRSTSMTHFKPEIFSHVDVKITFYTLCLKKVPIFKLGNGKLL